MSKQYYAENPFEDEEASTANPFEESSKSGPPPPAKPTTLRAQQPSPKSAPPELPPKISGTDPYDLQARRIAEFNTPIDMTEDGLRRKESELKRREDDLNNREQQLYQQEQSLPASRSRPKNWPRCRPIMYHNIMADMPTPEGQSLVKKAYFGWYAIVVALFWNVITLLSLLIVGSSGARIAGFFLALAFFFISSFFTLLMYRTLYNAVRKTKPSLYIIYFILLWLGILTALYFAIGIADYGGGGFIAMLDGFKENLVVGIFALVDTLAWLFIAGWHIYIFYLARREWKKAGGLRKARKDQPLP